MGKPRPRRSPSKTGTPDARHAGPSVVSESTRPCVVPVIADRSNAEALNKPVKTELFSESDSPGTTGETAERSQAGIAGSPVPSRHAEGREQRSLNSVLIRIDELGALATLYRQMLNVERQARMDAQASGAANKRLPEVQANPPPDQAESSVPGAMIEQLNRLLREREEMERDVARRFFELSDMSEALHRTEAQLGRRLAQVDGLLAENAELKSSIFWRLCSPLRAIGNLFGSEHRRLRKIIAETPLFDAAWYAQSHPSLTGEVRDPVDYFVTNGARDLHDPSTLFSMKRYLDDYPDVAQAGFNPLVHYLRFGRIEGRVYFPSRSDET